jgi:hypothetical protein
MTNDNSTDTRIAKITLKDGVIHHVYNQGATVTLADAQEEVAAIGKLSGGQAVPFLVDLRNTKSVAADARSYFSGQESAKLTLGVAFLVESAVSRVIGNFFIGLNKPPFSAKIFTSEDSAVDWLKKLIK